MGVDIGSLMIKRPIELKSLAGRKVAIDAYNTIYQFLSTIRQRDGTPLMDNKGRITSHLSGLLYRVSNLVEMGMKPIFVFDGEPPKFKQKTIEKRKMIKLQAARKLEEARERGEKELKTYAQATVRITDDIVNESKVLLDLMGIPVVQAPSEGEAEATRLVCEGHAYAVGSQDYDAILFGAPRLVRNLTLSGKRKLPSKGIWIDIEPEMINSAESLKALGIDRQRMIWAAIMIGTDYYEGIRGIGPKKGLAIVEKASSLENAFELAKAGDQYKEIANDLEEIERFFTEPPKPKQEPHIHFKEPQRDRIMDFMCGEHDFMIERIETALAKMTKKEEKKGQSKLEGWFD